jgi:dTDP-4-dehydrorhamnose 3,5-epimerase
MTFQISSTALNEVKIIRGTRFFDERGFFTETYKQSEYNAIGMPIFVQDNLSESAKGVIRGLHWQTSPFGQGKLVSCLSGSILDVAVDIRKESPTFGDHVLIELNASEPNALWIPEGFAHGFQSLEDNTRVHYKVTNYWEPTAERSLLWNDSELKIKWANIAPLISTKDKAAQPFSKLT